jgi:hypothetical protein
LVRAIVLAMTAAGGIRATPIKAKSKCFGSCWFGEVAGQMISSSRIEGRLPELLMQPHLARQGAEGPIPTISPLSRFLTGLYAAPLTTQAAFLRDQASERLDQGHGTGQDCDSSAAASCSSTAATRSVFGSTSSPSLQLQPPGHDRPSPTAPVRARSTCRRVVPVAPYCRQIPPDSNGLRLETSGVALRPQGTPRSPPFVDYPIFFWD